MQINFSLSLIEVDAQPKPSGLPKVLQGPADTPLKKLAQGVWLLVNLALFAWALSWFL